MIKPKHPNIAGIPGRAAGTQHVRRKTSNETRRVVERPSGRGMWRSGPRFKQAMMARLFKDHSRQAAHSATFFKLV